MFKKMVHICLALVMTVALTGCGAQFDHQAYVQSTLDAGYKGEVSEYVKLTDTTEDEAKKLYEDNITATVDEFSTSFESTAGASMTEDQKAQVKDIITNLLKSVSYETESAEKVDSNNYKVTVKVKPLKSLDSFEEKLTEHITTLTEQIQNGEIDLGMDLSDPDVDVEAATAKMMDIYMQGILDIFKEVVDSPEYGDEETMTVDVKLDTDQKLWYIPDSEIEKIDSALIGM